MPRWTLTDRRKELAVVHFKSQGTLSSLAGSPEFQCCYNTLDKHLKLHNITPKDINRIGLNTLKQDMYNRIYDQGNSKDEFNAGMKFLDKYDVDDVGSDDVEVKTDDVTIEEASLQILVDIGVK